MLSRWFSAPRASSETNGGGHHETPSTKEADFIVLPAAASDSWRTWLMTGVRKPPLDRRRMQGAHKALKRMLVEGTPPNYGTLPWNDFSSAMVRQAVDEALNALPAGHKQAVRLAYFGGSSNQEVAAHLGVGQGAIRRRLREALAQVSEHVEMGRVAARRTIYSIAVWFALRSLADFARRTPAQVSDHMVQAAVVVACGAMTAAVLAGSAPSPAQMTQVSRGGVATNASAPKSAAAVPNLPTRPVTGSVSMSPPVSAPLPPALPGAGTVPGKVTLPVRLPVTLPVTLPPIKPPVLHRIL
jgi:hypothetical protein